MFYCGAARLTAAACTLPAVSPLGGCVLCRAVVLPTSLLLPARCLPCRRRVVACRATLWCCPHCNALAGVKARHWWVGDFRVLGTGLASLLIRMGAGLPMRRF